jgi:hypothetical protein
MAYQQQRSGGRNPGDEQSEHENGRSKEKDPPGSPARLGHAPPNALFHRYWWIVHAGAREQLGDLGCLAIRTRLITNPAHYAASFRFAKSAKNSFRARCR